MLMLVAIVSEEFFTANNQEGFRLRKWLKQVDARSEKLSEGSFVNESTNKSTTKTSSARIAVIDKYSLF